MDNVRVIVSLFEFYCSNYDTHWQMKLNRVGYNSQKLAEAEKLC